MKKIISLTLAIVIIVTLLPVASYSKEYKTVSFGSYPQSRVTDNGILSVLNSDSSPWISYNYCYGENYIPVHGDYMKYKDVTYNNIKYRGVTFSNYRPESTSDNLGNTAINSYYINTNYWFKFEPIEWNILDEESGLIISSKVLDAQCFADDSALYFSEKIGYFSDATCIYAANNYEVSTIRNFLNSDFYTRYFTDAEKESIKSVSLDVSESIVNSSDVFSCENIFLLSKSEILNTSYFDSPVDYCTSGTDYALCQSLILDSSGNSKCCISRSGSTNSNVYSIYTVSDSVSRDCWMVSGIRPAMYIADIETQCEHDYILTSQENASCTTSGNRVYTCSKCKDTYTEIIPETGHSGGIANCVDKAICSICKTSYGELDSNNHKSVIVNEAVPATCTETGLTAGAFCESCNTVIQTRQTVDKLNHEYEISIVNPDCTNQGYTLYTCKNCTFYKTENFTAPLGHIGGNANCVDKAICIRCNKSYGETDPINHKAIVEDAEVPATCTTAGLTAGAHCEACSTVLQEQLRVEPAPHENSAQVIEPDCVNQGYTIYTCKNCNKSYKDNFVEPLGHTGGTANCVDKAICTRCQATYGEINQDNHKSVVEDKAIPATCTTTGLTAGTHCEACSKVIAAQNTVELVNHDYVTQVIASDCVNQGYTLHSCKNCTASYKDNYTDALGHTGGTANCVDKAICTRCQETYGEINQDNHKSVVEDKAVPATCTTTGLTSGTHCEACSKVITAQNTVELANHDYETQVIAPDCVNQGYILHSCKNCTASYKDNYTDALGHTGGTANCVDKAICTRCEAAYGEINQDNHKSVVEDKAVPATCTTTCLTAGAHCESCCKVIKAQQTINSIPHNYISRTVKPDCIHTGYTVYTCTVCGFVYNGSYTDSIGHTDSDLNGICDICNCDSRTEEQKNCNHICHKGGIVGFFWKIINKFNKFFKIKEFCDCGLRHW